MLQPPKYFPNLQNCPDIAQPPSTPRNRCKPVENTKNRLLSVAELNEQKERIVKAFKGFKLGFRAITTSAEKEYHDQPMPTPKPLYMVAEDVPVAMRTTTKTTIGIINPEPLFLYKANAGTSSLETGDKQPDELETKCLPDLFALRTKMNEQTERLKWEVYSVTRSGHLTAKGNFTPPRPYPAPYNTNQNIAHSELVTVSYEKEQIVCYCIPEEDTRNLSTILADKRTMEQTLEIATVPIALYSQRNGSIQVWFEQELPIEDDLTESETLLDDFARSMAFDPITLKNAFLLLPFPEHIRLLNTVRQNYVAPPTGMPTTRELLKLVTTPDEHSANLIKSYFKRGARIDHRVPYMGLSRSLLSVLLQSEIDRARGQEKFSNTHMANVKELMDELIRCSSSIVLEDFYYYLDCHVGSCPHLFDSLITLGLRTEMGLYNTVSIFYHYPTGPAATVLQEYQLSRATKEVLESQLKRLLIIPFERCMYFPDEYHQKLLMLFYYGADPTPFKERLIKAAEFLRGFSAENYRKMCAEKSPEQYADEIIALWAKRESNPLYINWPNKVEQARIKLTEMKSDLTPYPLPDCAVERIDMEQQCRPIVDAFEQKPIFKYLVGDNDETVLDVLQHYYRRPGPERILHFLADNKFPNVWKKDHSCSHVLRARNNVLWYMELLEQFTQIRFSTEEKTLLSLAAIYHDAAAEDVPKESEEERSALYFRRDLTEYFPTQLLALLSSALERKEDDIHGHNENELDQRLRLYMSVLRFGDRMDFVRCSNVGPNFPDWSQQGRNEGGFNVNLLDLADELKAGFTTNPEQKTAFQRALEAGMHGAVDLASITGGSGDDQRPQGHYTALYQLHSDNQKVQCAFETTQQPITRMDRFLDDNVRRMIARCADIDTCESKDHQECHMDTQNGVTHGIHNSWHDLAQVRIPPNMTRLEKMQCGYDLSVLSESTRAGIATEIERLKNEGIAMNLGTLTQQTLSSPAAIKVLDKRGIIPVIERRRRGFDQSEVRYHDVLVPKKKPKTTPTAKRHLATAKCHLSLNNCQSSRVE